MFRKKGFWIGLLIVLVLAAGGGYAYYRFQYLPNQAAEPTIETTEVRRGDLVISVSGSGTLSPVSEVDLGFQTGGYLDEMLVEVGDQVKEGDVLARLETDELKLAVAKAEINAREAQLDLADVIEGATDAELASAKAALQSAQSALTVAWYSYNSAQNSDLDASVRNHLIEYQWNTEKYWKAEEGLADGSVDQESFDEAWNDRGIAEGGLDNAIKQAEMEELDAWNQVDQAQNRVYQSQESLELLQSGPTTDTVTRAELKANQAALALDDARENLEAAELRAPFDGTVLEVNAIPGEYIETSAIIVLADLEEPVLQFWVEEADMSGVAVGNRVEIEFEALPDDTFTGEVIRVEPALVEVGNTLAVQAWASVDMAVASAGVNLVGGMNADIEIISAEATDALLVPVQALRELGPDQYAVFVVQPDGEMVLRPVEVGLQDFVSAEIVSGLELGETVSLGVEERTETTETEQEEMMPPGGGIMIPGGGMGPRGGF
jgi:HlyD family secretion protein